MTFGEKYELLETLTTGAVETFVAKDKVRGERVLVHILDCGAQKPNQPTVQWVLEGFQRVAPESAGLVLETGRYSGTQYAYLVAQLPDERVLRDWVRRYETKGQGIPESAQPPQPNDAPTMEISLKDLSRTPSPFTQAFQGSNIQAKADAPILPPKQEAPSAQPLPKISPAVVSGPTTLPYRETTAPQISPPPKAKPEPSGQSEVLRSDFTATNFPVQPNPPAPNSTLPSSPNPGEFTSFFRGPFSGDKPSDTPAVSRQEMEPREKKIGEFTAIFGAMNVQPEEAPKPVGLGPNPAREESSFTEIFKDLNLPSMTSAPAASSASSRLPQAASVDDSGFTKLPREPFSPTQPSEPPATRLQAYVPPPAQPVFTAPLSPTPIVERSTSARGIDGPPEGATRSFVPPVQKPAANEPAFSSGPSEYTRIIQTQKSPRPSGEGADGGQTPGKAAGAPAFPSIPLPAFPAMAAPVAPQVKLPPAPKMPVIAVPAPPAAPKPPKMAPPKAPVSYLPLILILTGLFLIAVLVVLYFLLRH